MAQLLIKGTKVAEVVGDTTSLIANTLYHTNGTQIISDDGGTVGLTNVNLHNINFDNVANNAISGDKIHGGTISGSILHTDVQISSLVGMIAAFAMSSPPIGWLACQGQTLDADTDTAYNPLWNVIGTTWGGTGSSSFKLPDLRGAFLRGIGDGNFSGRTKSGATTVGTFQEDQMQDHGHFATNLSGATNDYAAGSTNNYGWDTYNGTDYFRLVGGFHNAGGSNSNSTAGAEVRVYNAGVLYCIRWK